MSPFCVPRDRLLILPSPEPVTECIDTTMPNIVARLLYLQPMKQQMYTVKIHEYYLINYLWAAL